MASPDLLPANAPATLGNLQLLAKQVVEGFRSGLHKSPHKGFSVEFKEHRSYVPGDDPRTIDWKLYGKTDRLFIREHEQETNLRATLLVDSSGSMNYGGQRSHGLTKHDYAVRCAAALAHLMIRQQDGCGLVTFDTKVRRFIPPRVRPKHLTAILSELAKTKPGGETELGDVFHRLAAKLPRRGLLIVLSDLFGDVDRLLTSLAHLRHGGHEVVVFQILDPDEIDFPFDRRTRFRNLEDHDDHHTIDPAQVRRAYLEKLAAFRDALKKGCGRQRIGLVPLTTDRPFADALAAYLAARRRGR
ncbi:hypothetical protein LzC2_39330 [Planctomycetes bacterium LzC2]|uniref:VWFA domain-containing protein n=2 Tax=Alienimonas chondri TaxID=2681879 RepID=A0ABX1VI85_9PLAN|nr:hypothetical protein [Alienimonas chondri]